MTVSMLLHDACFLLETVSCSLTIPCNKRLCMIEYELSSSVDSRKEYRKVREQCGVCMCVVSV